MSNSMNTKFVPTRRKNSPYMPALIALAAVILLIVLYFALVRPLVNSGGGEEEPPVTTGPGEGVQYDLGTLYPSIKRSEMKVIRVHNADGTYEFRRMSVEEGKEPTEKSPFIIFMKREILKNHTVTNIT